MSTDAISLLRPRPSRFLPFLLFSLVGHVAAIGLALLFSWLFGAPISTFDQKPITASLVRLGKPRDEKLLPKKEEPLPPPASEPPKAAEVSPVKPDNAVLVPTKDAKAEPKKDTKKSLFDALNKTAKPSKPEELEGQADGDRLGDSAKQEGERYYGLLTAVVKRNYDVSNAIPEAERRRLHAVVVVRIGNNGDLIDVKLATPSGNELFDEAVVGAVKKAAPFTAPPSHLRDDLKKSGVPFDFSAL